MSPKKIAIIEDDNLLYTAMEILLQSRFKKEGITVEIFHFKAMAPAYHFLTSNKVDLISTDMGYPHLGGGYPVERFMGAKLIAALEEDEINVPIVIYSANEKYLVDRELKRLEVDFPEEFVFLKNQEDGEMWMQTIISTLKK
ncbi:MAG: hypothetical protein WCT07_02015 [Candidatus Paceibacterota bacterium]|jgi:DNA-binding NarL/FixJ family response regulator